jgi:hypothetical protein
LAVAWKKGRKILSGFFGRFVVYCDRLKQPMPISSIAGLEKDQAVGILHAWHNLKRNQAMTKSIEVITETINDPKHPFRKVDNQPKKELKHRYERRKIKEYLHLSEGDLALGEAT